MKDTLRAFIAGLALPSVVVPIIATTLFSMGKREILTEPFFHVIPLIWGLWNIFYFNTLRNIIPIKFLRLLITGAILGILIALFGVYWLHVPEKIGVPEQYHYLPLIGAPILYAIVWLFIVSRLNDLVGLKD